MRLLKDFLISALPSRDGIASSEKQETRSTKDIFGTIYRDKRWGRKISRRYFSGPGSHDPTIVEPYVSAVLQFLADLNSPPNVVDLGCGDFNVGRQLRPACARYVACDVVPELISYNKSKFSRDKVDFRCLDMINDDLPDGDIVMIRQVLQHLTNEQIVKVLPKLAKYRCLLLTEHVPAVATFSPNLDHDAGWGTRLSQNSGVVINAPPFNFSFASQRELCAVDKYGGLIKTIAYQISQP